MFERITVEIHDMLCAAVSRIKGDFQRSYSQFGEDLLLKSFMDKEYGDALYKGFWVDIGAHDPIRFSNTKIFSDRGWRGINVDALPYAIDRFKKYRPNDINVNVGIGEEHGKLEYYTFNDHAVNTFSKQFADKIIAEGAFEFLGVHEVSVITLKELLDAYLPPAQSIDFFTIDTEGLDLTILKSNDWTRYRPKYVLIEIHKEGRNYEIPTCDVTKYINEQGYVFAGQSSATTLYSRLDK